MRIINEELVWRFKDLGVQNMQGSKTHNAYKKIKKWLQ